MNTTFSFSQDMTKNALALIDSFFVVFLLNILSVVCGIPLKITLFIRSALNLNSQFSSPCLSPENTDPNTNEISFPQSFIKAAKSGFLS